VLTGLDDEEVGLSTSDVEQLVTVPLEQALNGVEGLEDMRSKSVPQLSAIELIFKQGFDELKARQLVQERMTEVASTLPTWAAPPVMLAPVSATGRAIQIGMTSKDHSLIQMSMSAYWTIRARLLEVPGVANVALWGERLQMMQVQVEPPKMEAQHVALNEVMEATADAVDSGLLRFSSGSIIGTGGMVESPNQRINVRNVLPIITPDDLARVPLHADRAGKSVKIGDIGRVVEDHQPLIGDAVINDSPGLLIVVEKLPWANTVEMTRGVEEAIRSLEPGLPGVEFDTTIFQQANFITASIHNLTQALVLGFVLVIVILALFLFEWRVALISVLTIPLSLMTTLLVLYWRGDTINTMTLAGLVIALGAVVDDAIIDVENIARRLRLASPEEARSPFRIVLAASLEVRSAVVYASLIVVLVFLPIFFLDGLAGAFFRPLALAYVLAILASLLVALTVTPALSLMLLPGHTSERPESPLTRLLRRLYRAVLPLLVERPRLAVGVLLAAFVLTGAAASRLGQEFLPNFQETDFLMHFVEKPGTSVEAMQRVTVQASKELRAIPGVRNFGAHIGQALAADEVVGMYFGENWISVDPKVDYDKTREQIAEVVAGYPGLFSNVETYLTERIAEVIGGESEPIIVRLLGPDLEVLRAKAQEVKTMLGGIDGVDEVNVELQAPIPQAEVDVDLEKAKQYGVKPGDVRRAAATIMSGEEVGDIFRDGKTYDVQVWSVPEARDSVEDISNVLVDTPSGTPVRLGDVATVTIRPTANFIKHEEGVRRLDVGAGVRGRDLGAVSRDVKEGLKSIEFPLEHRAEVIGVYAEREAATRRLYSFALVALAGIIALLMVVFKNWRDVVLHLVTLPIALVGGLLAAYMTNSTLSIGSLVGFFTVLGITARNGIMLISHFQHLEQNEGVPFGPELAIQGARERLAPILMTMLATGLALIPLIVTGDIAGQEIEYPMATVILGGLITSTLANLFIVPPLYLRFAKSRKWRAEHASAAVAV
jgi:CzcA family heavy metal efflux pump